MDGGRMKISIILVVTLFVLRSHLLGCTIFTSSSNNAVFAGNNEDMCTTSTIIHIIPPSDEKFGRIFWGFKNDENHQGGMNEHGLFFDGAGTPSVEMSEWSLPKYEGNYVMEGALENCKTVDETLKFIKNFKMPYLKHCHILVADAKGDAAIIEWGNNKLNFIRKGNNKYLIATNFNTTEIQNREHECYRYDIAKDLLSKEEPSLKAYEKILSLTHQEGKFCTVYSNICDLKNKKMYLYSFHNFALNKEFDLKQEFKKGEKQYSVRSFFPPSFAEMVYRMREDCISEIDAIPYKNVTFNIVSKNPIPLDSLYIRGSAVELGRWDKTGIQLNKESNIHFTKNIQLKEDALLDFQVTGKNGKYYPVNSKGVRFKEITFEVKSDTIITVNIFDWKIKE